MLVSCSRVDLGRIGPMTTLLIIWLESLLSSTNVKGFPIVSSDGALTLVGYIDRSEMRYVLGELHPLFPIRMYDWISNQSVLGKIVADWQIHPACLMTDAKVMMK